MDGFWFCDNCQVIAAILNVGTDFRKNNIGQDQLLHRFYAICVVCGQ
jgi:hypothetical protein